MRFGTVIAGARPEIERLERIPIEWIGMRSAYFALAHVLIGKPVSTFPEHAPSRGRAVAGRAA